MLASCATYPVCISFCKPLVARYNLIGTHFPWVRLPGVIQIHEYVTENGVPKLHEHIAAASVFATLRRQNPIGAVDFLWNGQHRLI